MENLELTKNRMLEVEVKLSEYNNLIIENDPKSLTKEFEEEYRALQKEYEELKLILNEEKNEKKEKVESFFNKVSLGLFFYFVIMFILAFPLIEYLIGFESSLAILERIGESTKSFTELQVKTLAVIGFVAYPFVLTIINTIVGLIFVRSKENKKVYFIWNIIFALLVVISVIWGIVFLSNQVFA